MQMEDDDHAQAGNRFTVKVQDPILPSKDEVEEHMKTHLPYRSWCSHCVRGRGRAADHKKREHEDRTIPEIHMDYMFMGNQELKGDKDSKAATMLGVKERDRRMHMATVVPKKGGSVEFVAKRVIAFLDEMGCKNIAVTFKTDQEPAIIDLVNTMKKLRVDLVTYSENSPVGASASNGAMERGIQSLEG